MARRRARSRPSSLQSQAHGHGPLAASLLSRFVSGIGQALHSTKRSGSLTLHTDLNRDRSHHKRFIGPPAGNPKAIDSMAAKGHRIVSDTQGDLSRQRFRHASKDIGEHAMDGRIERFGMTGGGIRKVATVRSALDRQGLFVRPLPPPPPARSFAASPPLTV